ncbi:MULTISPECIES: S-formylglutathione hydrolase [unclassified Okeania]|uniref:S-formylglutathione hydrolase n=1 Tax=unclassified Okeania TaxID=2634635 RepID=UPI0013B970E1|nr:MULTISPECIES: S-formylglutathione hydrolase [unclassified Okeania]NES76481.1 S-formylglutathione hydrolase [Okeania sp. SIO1H4]NET20346.1 S-formylglutathione hydrolase [Okeania sp. SIO1H5]NET77065.1 S-formylglutathione hydrolase [Okeania sp. SIO1F9]NET95611.1 S-formylglutathione hydrolase [Okeania sp. SIO1H2]
MSTELKLVKEHQCFGGKVIYYFHSSYICNIQMRFSIYLPPEAKSKPLPVLYFLSGLTCTEENFMAKAGAQQFAAKYGLILVVPDTSPRNTGIKNENDSWDFGTGAGFYLDATLEPWKKHYQMYSYVVKELPELIAKNFPIQPDKQSIFGHSMGGHGALICAIKNPAKYQSISAFAPIAAPMCCPWGEKAFSNYLGSNQENWRDYDASELILNYGYSHPILIDIGTADPFLSQKQLLPEVLEKACQKKGVNLTLRMQKDYDHSYYFIASFIEDHIRYHAEALN